MTPDEPDETENADIAQLRFPGAGDREAATAWLDRFADRLEATLLHGTDVELAGLAGWLFGFDVGAHFALTAEHRERVAAFEAAIREEHLHRTRKAGANG